MMVNDDDDTQYSHSSIVINILSQEAEEARKKLYELQAVTAAVESSGHTKAEARVSLTKNSVIK